MTDLETQIHATEKRNQGQGAPLAAKQLVVSGAALGAMESGRTAGDFPTIIRIDGAPICHTNNSKFEFTIEQLLFLLYYDKTPGRTEQI